VTLLPLFVELEGRRVVVIGAGAAVERKIAELAAAGAKVEVIAPDATDRVRALSVTWHARRYERGDLEGAWLAVSATGDHEVAHAIRAEAEALRVWLLAVDDVTTTCVYSAAIIRRPPLVVAISSTGEAPALVRLMREVLERALPDAGWIQTAQALRRKWKSEGTPHTSRFAELLASNGTPESIRDCGR
jgi:siroheme synthase-like protein